MFTLFPSTAGLSTNPLREFVLFWNDGVHTGPSTAELSTNSLREFVVFWNDDVHTVSIHSGAFNQFPEGILRCLGIMISPNFQHSGPFKYPPCGVFHSVVNIPLESDPLELSLSTFI